jgi:ribosomal-protein-serine acetyltransferase
MIQRPPIVIPIEKGLKLRVSRVSDAASYLAVVESSRENLKPWLPWAHMMFTTEQFAGFIKSKLSERRNGNEFGYHIELDGVLIGRISLIRFEYKNDKVEVGYWIATEHQGKGLMTKIVREVISIAFDKLQMERVEIRCALGNDRSAGIPRRLGFTLEGVLKHAEKTESGYRDLQLWAMTSGEWVEKRGF